MRDPGLAVACPRAPRAGPRLPSPAPRHGRDTVPQEASASPRRISGMVVVLGIDPGTAHTGFGVVLSRGQQLAALDGGVIGTGPDEALERRLARIHARVVRPDRRARARRRSRSRTSSSARTRARRSPSARRAARSCCRPGMARHPVLLVHAAGGQAGGLRVAARADKQPGAADGRRAARRCPSRRSPTTPPTRSPSRSATPTAPACKAALA